MGVYYNFPSGEFPVEVRTGEEVVVRRGEERRGDKRVEWWGEERGGVEKVQYIVVEDRREYRYPEFF